MGEKDTAGLDLLRIATAAEASAAEGPLEGSLEESGPTERRLFPESFAASGSVDASSDLLRGPRD